MAMDDARMARLQAMMDLLMAPPGGGGGGGGGGARAGGDSRESGALPDFVARTVLVRTATLRELRRLKQLPLPRRVPVLLTRVVLRGVPSVPGGIFSPLLHVSTAPYQGATTRVIYSSAWTNPVPLCYPSAPAAGAGAGAIAFPMAARITGDILLSCTALSVAPGTLVAIGHQQAAGGVGGAANGGFTPPAGAGAGGATVGGNAALSSAPSSAALFRFSFHTAFMLGDAAAAALGTAGARDASGSSACVYRLPLADLDIEHRKKNEGMFPRGFSVELHFSFDAAAVVAPAVAAKAAGAGAAPATLRGGSAPVGERHSSPAGTPAAELELPPFRAASAPAAPVAPVVADGCGQPPSVDDELAASLGALQAITGVVASGAGGGAPTAAAAAAAADDDDDDDDDDEASLDGTASVVDEELGDHPHDAAPAPQRTVVGLRVDSHSGTPVPVVLLQHAGGVGGVGTGSGPLLSGSGHLEDMDATSGGGGGGDVVAMGNLAKAGGVLGTTWRRRFCVLRRVSLAPAAPPSECSQPPALLASAVAGAATAALSVTGSAALQVTLGQLHYFASSRDATPRGSIPLSLASLRRTRVTWPPGHPGAAAAAAAAAADVDDRDAGEEEGARDGGAAAAPAAPGGGVGTPGGRDRPFTIALRSRGRRFFLQAADEADLRRWLAALAALVPGGEAVPPQLRAAP